MWVVRDKNGNLLLFNQKPVRSIDYFDGEVIERWTRDIEKYPPVHFSSKTALYDPNYQIMVLDSSLFPELTWEDEPIECNLFPIDKVPSDETIKMILELGASELTTEEIIEIVKKELYQL